ncbi:MAG: MarR family transcriptional regulator [Clostridia bacterium]|nr:MarR family transcriptional regulator [Clostridia bacterium]
MPSLMKKINVISRCAATYKSERYEGELSVCQHAFVLFISKNPGKSQDEIAYELCFNKSTVARTLSYLEENGYVRRESDGADKRVLRVYPTDKMLSECTKIRKLIREWNSLISEDLSEEELSAFLVAIEKIEKRARRLALEDKE